MSNLSPYENNGLEQKDESLTSNAGEGGTPSPHVVMSYTEKEASESGYVRSA
jgi:hypothetical protein